MHSRNVECALTTEPDARLRRRQPSDGAPPNAEVCGLVQHVATRAATDAADELLVADDGYRENWLVMGIMCLTKAPRGQHGGRRVATRVERGHKMPLSCFSPCAYVPHCPWA